MFHSSMTIMLLQRPTKVNLEDTEKITDTKLQHNTAGVHFK